MSIRAIVLSLTALTLVAATDSPLLGAAEQVAAPPVVKNLSEQKLQQFPGLPSCVTGVVLSGDPAKGATVIESRAATGCRIPWHWHSSNEHLMMVSGVGRLEMKDAKPATVHSGAYAMLPAHHAHQLTCTTSCTVFLYSDGIFDTHYIDASGAEIPATEALKKK
jgi:quercetin dioxygenase-like cupin family protein